MCKLSLISIFFFNDTATTAIYTYLHPLSLHDALPIWPKIPSASWHCLMFKDDVCCFQCQRNGAFHRIENVSGLHDILLRSEEQTSELQSLMRSSYDVFSLKKKNHLQHSQRTEKNHTKCNATYYRNYTY